MKFIITVSFIFLILHARAQKLNEDSIRQVIQTTSEDTLRVHAQQVYANYLIRHKGEDSNGLRVLEESKMLADKIGFNNGIARYYLVLGNFYQDKNKWGESIDAFNQMKAVARNIKDENSRNNIIMRANNNLAGIYYYNGDFTGSLDYHLQSLVLAEKTQDTTARATLYVNIASDYRQLHMPAKAIAYLQRINPLLPGIKDALKIAYYYELYQNQLLDHKTRDAWQSLQFIKKGLSTFNLSRGQQLDLAMQYFEQAGTYEMNVTRNYAVALMYFRDFLSNAKQAGDNFSATEALYHTAWAYDSLKQYNNAIEAARRSYTDAIDNDMMEFAFRSADLLADAYQRSGKSEEGLHFSRIALQLKDSLASADKLKELNFLEAKYQAQKKEKEIADLQIMNAEKALTVLKRNRLLVAGGISAAALVLILGLLYRSSRQKQLIAVKEKQVKQQQISFLEQQQQVISMQSMINGQETERTRIARDLHDGLGGLFSTVKMHFSTLQHDIDLLKNNELFQKSAALVDTASVEVRRIAHNMMPEVLLKLGLVQALQDLCSSTSAGKLLNVRFQSYGMEKRLNASSEIMLYRIIQELLNNIIKHAHASQAIIQFNREGKRLSVTVEDNGRGFDLEETALKKQAGMDTVKTRVSYLNGNISIDSQENIGTTVLMDFLVNE